MDSCCKTSQKEPARIEGALDSLLDKLARNEMLAGRISDQIFTSRPTKECDQNNILEPTLANVLLCLADQVQETNEKLEQISECLDEQLGEIKLD